MSEKAMRKRAERLRRYYRPMVGARYDPLPKRDLVVHPTSTYPQEIRFFFAEYAQYLKESIQRYSQQVELVPSRTPNHSDAKIRCCTESNPLWYAHLIEVTQSDSSRRVVRSRVETALDRIAGCSDKSAITRTLREAKGPNTIYAKYTLDEMLRELCAQHLCRGYYDDIEDLSIPPINEARIFFGLPRTHINEEQENVLREFFFADEDVVGPTRRAQEYAEAIPF